MKALQHWHIVAPSGRLVTCAKYLNREELKMGVLYCNS